MNMFQTVKVSFLSASVIEQGILSDGWAAGATEERELTRGQAGNYSGDSVCRQPVEAERAGVLSQEEFGPLFSLSPIVCCIRD